MTLMHAIEPDTQPDKRYDPPRCREDGCDREARWGDGWCIRHWIQHSRESGKEEDMPATIPLEQFREVVERSSTLTEAAQELGLKTCSVATRCKDNHIPTPAQRQGKTTHEGVPLDRLKEVVARSTSPAQAAAELGISASGVSSRCRKNGIPRPWLSQKGPGRRAAEAHKEAPPRRERDGVGRGAEGASSTPALPCPTTPSRRFESMQAEWQAVSSIVDALARLDDDTARHRVLGCVNVLAGYYRIERRPAA